MYSVVSKNFTNVQGYDRRKWMNTWENRKHNYIKWAKSLSHPESIDVVK